jgi:hypothetical protein
MDDRYFGSYPIIDDEAINEILSIEMVNLGGGVIAFRNAFKFDQQKLLSWIDKEGKNSNEQRWKFDYDVTGQKYAINEDGNKFSIEQMNEVPVRVLQVVHENTEKDMVEFFKYLEDSIYKCVIKYVHEFPMVLPTLWWRTRGHALRYSKGMYLGVHNDNDTNFRAEKGKKYIPKGQLGARQTIAIMAYFNDCVNEGEVGENQYSGGELFFPYLGIKYQAKAGDIVVFPCNFIATHGVHTVKEGNRYGYLTFYAQGSGDPNVLVEVFEVDTVKAWCEPHWLEPLYEDYKKYCGAEEFGKPEEELSKKPNPLFQNRSLEGEEGLKQAYRHADVFDANNKRGKVQSL